MWEKEGFPFSLNALLFTLQCHQSTGGLLRAAGSPGRADGDLGAVTGSIPTDCTGTSPGLQLPPLSSFLCSLSPVLPALKKTVTQLNSPGL